MPRRQPLPRLWLMTDERGGDPAAHVRALPKGKAGIVFRHYDLPLADRRVLFDRVRKAARARRLMLILAAAPQMARGWRADGAHHRSLRHSAGLRTVAVHSARELVTARRVKADLIFVSPVFATRSHPDARPLGAVRLGLLVGTTRGRTIALGGMSARRMRRVSALGLYGWAGIDAFARRSINQFNPFVLSRD